MQSVSGFSEFPCFPCFFRRLLHCFEGSASGGTGYGGDCAFREGDGWILLDYKTDTIRDEEAFVEEYRPQLAWYAKALRDLTGMPVRESWLYALSVDKAFALGGQEQA